MTDYLFAYNFLQMKLQVRMRVQEQKTLNQLRLDQLKDKTTKKKTINGGNPPAARKLAIRAKGKAKTECLNLIISSSSESLFHMDISLPTVLIGFRYHYLQEVAESQGKTMGYILQTLWFVIKCWHGWTENCACFLKGQHVAQMGAI